MEHCTSLCLIITELVLNVIDSAFPNNKQGNLYLKLNKIKDKVKINVIDDGIGLPKDFNIHKVNTTGFFIINNLINQLNGTIKNIPEHKGTNIEIMFPEKN
jgi:two-component sensor histidine kinase